MLDEVTTFLNDKNREYAQGDADYNWSLLADNCVHTVRNALAAANIWSPLSVQTVKLLHLLNLAVPANEFVNLAELGTEGNIEDYRHIAGDGPQRDALHEFGWLPTRHGALLKTLAVHEPNDLYATTFRLFTLQSPLRMAKTRHAVDLLSDERFVSLTANLRHFRDKYDAILARCRDPRSWPRQRARDAGPSRRAAALRVRRGAARRGGGHAAARGHRGALTRTSSAVKRVLVVGLGVVLFGAVLLWALPEILRRVALDQIPRHLGRAVVIEDVDLNVFTRRLRVTNLRLAERRGDQSFVEVERVEARFAPTALFRSNVRLTELVLVRPVGRLVRTERGAFNVSDLLELVTAARAARSGRPPGRWSFTVDRLKIAGGALTRP